MVDKTRNIHVRVEEAIYDKAKAKADYEGHALSVILRAALEAYIREGITYEDLRDLGKRKSQ